MVGTNPEEVLKRVLDDLKGRRYACQTLEKLSGGSANFVYRGSLIQELPDGSKTVIIKHSAPYMATNPSFQLTVDRANYEHVILSTLEDFPSRLHAGITIKTPRVFGFQQSTKIQIYSDLSSSTELKKYLLTHSLTESQCSRLGYALGTWTKQSHQWGAKPEQSTLRKTMTGNQVMKNLKFLINYPRLGRVSERYSKILEDSGSIFEAVEKDAKNAFDYDDNCLIHGDFWTGNVLLKNAPFPKEDDESTVFIVDWEFSHTNSISIDLGQMFAELFEVKHFRDIDSGVWIIEAFLNGYGAMTQEKAFKLAIHMGAHLVCWGSSVSGWGSQEQVEKVVEIGRDYIVNGWKKNARFFTDTPLASLFA